MSVEHIREDLAPSDLRSLQRPVERQRMTLHRIEGSQCHLIFRVTMGTKLFDWFTADLTILFVYLLYHFFYSGKCTITLNELNDFHKRLISLNNLILLNYPKKTKNALKKSSCNYKK